MPLLSPAAPDDNGGAEVWESLGHVTAVALEILQTPTARIEAICGMPYAQVRRIIAEDGSVALAESIIRLLEITVADLKWSLRDLRATTDRVLDRGCATGELLP